MVDITERLRLNATDWIFGDTAITALKEINTLRQRVAELDKERSDCGELGLELCEQFEQLTAERDALKKLYESSEESVLALKETRNRLAEERDKATQYWNIAEGRCDALMKQRDDLLAVLEKLTDVFANIGITSGLYDDEQDALKAACDAIASVKEK